MATTGVGLPVIDVDYVYDWWMWFKLRTTLSMLTASLHVNRAERIVRDLKKLEAERVNWNRRPCHYYESD